jgi:hypothetical protein
VKKPKFDDQKESINAHGPGILFRRKLGAGPKKPPVDRLGQIRQHDALIRKFDAMVQCDVCIRWRLPDPELCRRIADDPTGVFTCQMLGGGEDACQQAEEEWYNLHAFSGAVEHVKGNEAHDDFPVDFCQNSLGHFLFKLESFELLRAGDTRRALALLEKAALLDASARLAALHDAFKFVWDRINPRHTTPDDEMQVRGRGEWRG